MLASMTMLSTALIVGSLFPVVSGIIPKTKAETMLSSLPAVGNMLVSTTL